MRLYHVIRNDKEPMSIRAEKVVSAKWEHIFSNYNKDSGYDVVVATIPAAVVVEITSEALDAPKRVYTLEMTDGTSQTIVAECTKVIEGEMVFMDYDDTYSSFTTVTSIEVSKIKNLKTQ